MERYSSENADLRARLDQALRDLRLLEKQANEADSLRLKLNNFQGMIDDLNSQNQNL